MGCEALATKSEVAELRQTVAIIAGQLATKIDKSERQPIVEDSINGANARYGLALVPVALPALTTLIPYIAGLIALLSSFLGLQNLINGLQSLIGSHQSDIDRILGRLRFIEDKNSEQDELLHYFRDYAIPILKADISILQRDSGKANAEITRANNEIKRLDSELSKANAAIGAANAEIKRVAGIASQAASDATKAIAEAQAINQKLEREYKPVIQLAISKADFAIQTINNLGNDLIEELQTQSGRISSLENQNTRLASLANAARADANRAIEIANNALSASQQAQSTANNAASSANNAASTANTVSQEVRGGVQIRYFEPTITNAIVRINQQVTNTSIQQASNEIQRTLSQGNQQINQQYAAAAQASTQIKNVSIAEASAEIQQRLASASNDIQRTLSEAAAKARATVEPLVIERAIAASPTIQDLRSRTTAPTIQPALQAEIANLKGRITEQERMNERGLTEIGVIAGAIAALPNTFAQNSSYRAAMTDVAAAGTCQTTRPGGCMANQVQSLRNGQNDILNGLGLASQAGQGAVLSAMQNTLNTVNSKLGAQIPGIGIGGKLSNFVNWSVADRVTGLVTMFASLHNTMMLTNSVKETFLDVLDNLLNTGYNLVPNLFKKADEDAAIDSREYIGGAINTFFGGLFGVTEWTALQQQWKAYSTIYASSTNAYDNLRSIHSDTQELLNRQRKDIGELGNALVDEGLISEENWEYRDTDKRVKSKSLMRLERMNQGLEALDTKLEALEQVTQLVLNITNTAKEIKENADEIGKAFKDADKAATLDRNAKVEGLEVPNFNLVDFLDGD